MVYRRQIQFKDGELPPILYKFAGIHYEINDGFKHMKCYVYIGCANIYIYIYINI